MNNKYCQHCYPTKRKNHFSLHIEFYSEKFINFFLKPLNLLPLKINKNYLWGLILEFLSLFKIINFIEKPDKTKLQNRGLIFLKEAERRGLNVKTIALRDKYINEFKLIYQGKRYYYECIPLKIKQTGSEKIDDKYWLKKTLQKNNIPVARGGLFLNRKKAFKFGKKIGFPLAVKPNSGSLSYHLTCPINSPQELKKAIKIAKIYKPDFIIEEYIKGNLYRATVAGNKFVFTAKKEKANIVGDGCSTIEELIKFKNNNKKRGKNGQVNYTLHEISIDSALKEKLKKQGLNLKSIPAENKKVYLQDKFILSRGCDVINCSKKIHPDNKKIFLKIAEILKTNLVGIDFICPNITKSYREQKTAVLEANSLPYIDMHQNPSFGQPDEVAKIVWDLVLDNLKKIK